MKTRFNKELISAALIRAVRTMAQTALGMITIGATLTDVDWFNILSVSTVAGIYSLLLSLAGDLPEAESDGELLIDTTGESDIYRLDVDIPLHMLANEQKISLTVRPDADLTQ